MVRCEEVDELAGALALGAALPEEVAAVRAHLAACTSDHPELGRLAATAALLAEAAEPVEPPPRLREHILAAARVDREGSEVADPASEPEEAGAAGGPRRAADAIMPLPGRGATRRAWALPGWLAAAAVFAVAVGLGAWNVSLQRDLRDRDDELAAQQQALASLARGGQVVAFNVAPQLAGARGAVLRPAQGQPVVVLEGLRRPEGGAVYQLWAMQGGRPVDLGVFLPDEDGLSVIPLPDLTGAEAVAVTVEPRRVPQPTADPVLVAPFSSRTALPVPLS